MILLRHRVRNNQCAVHTGTMRGHLYPASAQFRVATCALIGFRLVSLGCDASLQVDCERVEVNFSQTEAFRQDLRACWQVRAEFKTAGLAHAFPSVVPRHDRLHDVTIKELFSSTSSATTGGVPVMEGTEFPANFSVAHEGLSGMAPFKNDSRPMWAEAADRLVCVSLDHIIRSSGRQLLPVLNAEEIAGHVTTSSAEHRDTSALLQWGQSTRD